MSNIGIVGSKLNAVGGLVTQGKDFCKVNGVAVAYVGSKGTTHVGPPPHVQDSGPYLLALLSSRLKVLQSLRLEVKHLATILSPLEAL